MCWSTAKTVQGTAVLQELEEVPETGKIVGPESLQLIKLVSAPETKKVLRFPVPGTVVPSGRILSRPLGLRLRPPPLNMKVRIEGCTKIIPKPERRTVLPVPKTSQATPRRGEKLL